MSICCERFCLLLLQHVYVQLDPSIAWITDESHRFRAMVDAGSSIEHLAVSSNDIGDEGSGKNSRGNQSSCWHLGRVREIKLKYAEIMEYWIYGNERCYYILLWFIMVVLYVNCTKTIWYWMCVCHDMIYNQSLLWFCIILRLVDISILYILTPTPPIRYDFFHVRGETMPSKSNQDILVFPWYSHDIPVIPIIFPRDSNDIPTYCAK